MGIWGQCRVSQEHLEFALFWGAISGFRSMCADCQTIHRNCFRPILGGAEMTRILSDNNSQILTAP